MLNVNFDLQQKEETILLTKRLKECEDNLKNEKKK